MTKHEYYITGNEIGALYEILYHDKTGICCNTDMWIDFVESDKFGFYALFDYEADGFITLDSAVYQIVDAAIDLNYIPLTDDEIDALAGLCERVKDCIDERPEDGWHQYFMRQRAKGRKEVAR